MKDAEFQRRGRRIEFLVSLPHRLDKMEKGDHHMPALIPLRLGNLTALRALQHFAIFFTHQALSIPTLRTSIATRSREANRDPAYCD
jgi:hypothetical protein